MNDLQTSLQKLLKKYNLNLSESTVSMVLGAVVVVIIGLLAYNYFRLNRQTASVTPAEVSTTNQQNQENANPTNGETVAPGSSVALPTTHTVAANESLWSISEKYFASGYNWVDISAANQLNNPNKIWVGQQLTIPKVEVRKPAAMTANAMFPTVVDSKIEGSSYTVQKGDNLWSIALRAYGDGFKWSEIARANSLTRPNFIHAGNVLILPR